MRFHEKKVHLINCGKNSTKIFILCWFFHSFPVVKTTFFDFWPISTIFRHFPPFFTYTTLTLILFDTFCHKINFLGHHEPSFIMSHWLIFSKPLDQLNNLCRGNIYFVPYINQHHIFFCTLAKSLWFSL